MNVLRIKRIYENSRTGLCTSEIVEGYEFVRDFLFSRGLNPVESIRCFQVNKAGNVTFKHGGNYNFLDANLLAGTGDGSMLKLFRKQTGCRIL